MDSGKQVFLRPSAVARELDVNPARLRRLLGRSALPVVRVDGDFLVPLAALIAWRDGRTEDMHAALRDADAAVARGDFELKGDVR